MVEQSWKTSFTAVLSWVESDRFAAGLIATCGAQFKVHKCLLHFSLIILDLNFERGLEIVLI